MKTHYLSILFSLLLILTEALSPLSAQSPVTPPTQLPDVANAKHTQLVFPGSRQAFKPFYGRLNALRKAQAQGYGLSKASEVNIFHIGGSHVQAGELSNTIRMRFEPTADRGLLFPFRAIKTNGPSSYRFDYTGMWKGSRNVAQMPDVDLGLAGAAAVTSDKSATITLQLRDNGRWNFQQLLLLGQASDASVIPYLTTQTGDTLWADPILSRIADVEGTWTFQLLQPDSVVTLHLKGLTRTVGEKQNRKTYMPLDDSHYFILRGMMPITGRRGITYTESGVNGASLQSWERCTYHFDQELALLPPDLAIFGVGINDAHIPESEFDPEVFKQRYRALVGRIRAINPDCCFIWITNNDCAFRHGRGRKVRYTANKNGARVQQAMLELAKEFDGAVFDVYSLMGGLGSSAQWVKAGLMQRDRVHFTNQGYQLIGNLLADAIWADYGQYYKD